VDRLETALARSGVLTHARIDFEAVKDTMATMYRVQAGGQVVPLGGMPSYRHASCGLQFSQYVKLVRTSDFPFCQNRGGSQQHTNLWPGRTLKIKLHKDAPNWRLAKVESFLEWLSGPLNPKADWDLTVRFTDVTDVNDNKENPPAFAAGDIIEIHGLQGAKQHNGRQATVVSLDETTGRVAVYFRNADTKCQTLAVKPCNLKHVEVCQFKITRCNVEGGGTMSLKSDYWYGLGTNDLISFEWLEEATPEIHTDDGWCVTCPTCRAVTSSHHAVNRDNSAQMECPVCMEAKKCTAIGTCGHFVCGDCFHALKKKPDGTFFFNLEKVQVNLSPEHLDRKRAKLFNCCQAPPTFDEIVRLMGEAFPEAPDDNDLDKLIAMKQWFLVRPLHLWMVLHILIGTLTLFGPNAAEIVVDYVESLKGTDLFVRYVNLLKELLARKGSYPVAVDTKTLEGRRYKKGIGKLLNDPDQYHTFLMVPLIGAMGEKYEKLGDFRRAIGWYEKNLLYAPVMASVGTLPLTMATCLTNLGLAQKRAGMLESAERSYRQALTYSELGPLRGNLEQLLFEMEAWSGTGGKTPRMEE
jgi:ssDNA-binding Zn-finger/Zn-ribbon topoisomerase 1